MEGDQRGQLPLWGPRALQGQAQLTQQPRGEGGIHQLKGRKRLPRPSAK